MMHKKDFVSLNQMVDLLWLYNGTGIGIGISARFIFLF